MKFDLTQIPALYRKWIYMAYAFVGLCFGGVGIAYATLGDTVPKWYGVALAVFAYIGTASHLTAAANVGPNDTPPPAPAGPSYKGKHEKGEPPPA